jgi:hypothetical protein
MVVRHCPRGKLAILAGQHHSTVSVRTTSPPQPPECPRARHHVYLHTPIAKSVDLGRVQILGHTLRWLTRGLSPTTTYPARGPRSEITIPRRLLLISQSSLQLDHHHLVYQHLLISSQNPYNSPNIHTHLARSAICRVPPAFRAAGYAVS